MRLRVPTRAAAPSVTRYASAAGEPRCRDTRGSTCMLAHTFGQRIQHQGARGPAVLCNIWHAAPPLGSVQAKKLADDYVCPDNIDCNGSSGLQAAKGWATAAPATASSSPAGTRRTPARPSLPPCSPLAAASLAAGESPLGSTAAVPGRSGTATGSRTAAGCSPKQAGGPCVECGTTRAPQWRKTKDTGQVVCNACGLRMSRAEKALGARG